MNTELIRTIAENEPLRKNVVAYLKQVQDEIADVRQGDYTAEARLCAVNLIDTLIIKKLNVLSPRDKQDEE